MALKHAQAELKTKQAEMKKMDGGYKKDQDALRAVQSSREALQAQLDKLGYEGALGPSCRSLWCSGLDAWLCVQMGRRSGCWTGGDSCPEKSPSWGTNTNIWCPASPTCALITGKSAPAWLDDPDVLDQSALNTVSG